MQVLHQRANEEFIVDQNFHYEYFAPIGSFVQWKVATQQWDDYNELYHATRVVEALKREPGVWMETHLLRRDQQLIGVLFILGGELTRVEQKYPIANEPQAVLLKYFHIIDKGKGYGHYWLTAVLFPYYKARGYSTLYASSSHAPSFPFYQRLGAEIARYQQPSDNECYTRQGRCFAMAL